MRNSDPPLLAKWILEHATAGELDEALAGDLREGYSAGLSDGWYWRQVLAACAVSWSESVRARIPLLIFALLWSMMAPASKVFVDRIEDAAVFDRILTHFGGAWVFPALAGWLVLNSIFLWCGISVFVLSHSQFRVRSCGKMLRRAFLVASLVFLPLYACTFLWFVLYWYSFFANAKFPTAVVGQIVDLQMLADILRLPYLIALLSALWNIVPRSRRPFELLDESAPAEPSIYSGSPIVASTQDSSAAKRFLVLMAGAGLINAMIASILLCRLPESHWPTLSSILLRGVLVVAVGVVAGVGGSWAYWKRRASPFREHSPVPFALFALVCASGWAWVAPMTVFSEQLSPATAVVAPIAAIFLAIGLRGTLFSHLQPAALQSAGHESETTELFSQSLYQAPWELYGYGIAILLYAGIYALSMRWNLPAALLFAVGAFLFAWKQTFISGRDSDSKQEIKRAKVRLAYVACCAVLVTTWGLLDGAAHREPVTQTSSMFSAIRAKAEGKNSVRKGSGQSSTNELGYQSLILWPFPKKTQIVPPPPSEDSVLAPGTTRPLVIPFNGAYWFVQPPDKRPGPTAYKARGTPIRMDIHSNNGIPLVMDAHQSLSTPVRIAGYRNIEVEIENHDNTAGAISLALLLADGTSPHARTLYLGEQPIVSTESEHFSLKQSPVDETLSFSVPATGDIQKFNEITVLVLPGIEHAFIAPKIAILQFRLLPR